MEEHEQTAGAGGSSVFNTPWFLSISVCFQAAAVFLNTPADHLWVVPATQVAARTVPAFQGPSGCEGGMQSLQRSSLLSPGCGGDLS